MSESVELQWLFLDLNSYFASVEQQLRPELRGQPVAVVPVMTDSTCAIAVSYEAKAFGIRTGTPIYEARRLCPGLHLIPARHEAYVEFHEKVLEEIGNYIPVTQVCSIDEVACHLDTTERTPETARALARRIKTGLAERVGVCLRCSIGVAPNRFLAKVASNLEKPDGLVVLEPRDLPEALYRLELRDLPGIGRRMEERLRAAGIHDIRTFWHLAPKQAREIWGSIAGELFWHRLHGLEISEPQTRRRTVGHSHVLGPQLRAPDQARLVARRLAAKAASRLRRLGCSAGRVCLGLRFENGQRWHGERRLAPCQDTLTLLSVLSCLWNEMQRTTSPGAIKKVSVTLQDLVEAAQASGDLFALQEGRTRKLALSQAMDNLNTRFGRNTVNLGPLPAHADLCAGTKIAFTRIPEREDFRE